MQRAIRKKKERKTPLHTVEERDRNKWKTALLQRKKTLAKKNGVRLHPYKNKLSTFFFPKRLLLFFSDCPLHQAMESIPAKQETQFIWIQGKPRTGRSFVAQKLCECVPSQDVYHSFAFSYFWPFYRGQEYVILYDCHFDYKQISELLNPNLRETDVKEFNAKRVVIISTKTLQDLLNLDPRDEVIKLEEEIDIVIHCVKKDKIRMLKGKMPTELEDCVEDVSQEESMLEALKYKIHGANVAAMCYMNKIENPSDFQWYTCFCCKKLNLGLPRYLQKHPGDDTRAYCQYCLKDCTKCGEENPKQTDQCIVCLNPFESKKRAKKRKEESTKKKRTLSPREENAESDTIKGKDQAKED